MQINHSNYEAFYLDYLEGNLSGETLEAFEAFLAAHPELSIDDPVLPTLEPTGDSFNATQKLALKKGIDMDDLNTETIDFFLIAREEGLLNSDQQLQLNHWLEANAHYQQDARLYSMIRLESDDTAVYTQKSTLKKQSGRIIPMWWPGVAVAAGLALIFTIGMNNPFGNNTRRIDTVAQNDTVIPIKQPDTHSGVDSQKSAGTEKKRKEGTKKEETLPQHQPSKPKRYIHQRNILLQDAVLATLEKRKANLNVEEQNTVQPLPADFAYAAPDNTPSQEQTDLAWLPVTEMTNPIEPVTDKLSTTLNTPVDFRTAKASRRKGGGFYLKIGKLEVSHQSASLW
jgi:hypothetical protein